VWRAGPEPEGLFQQGADKLLAQRFQGAVCAAQGADFLAVRAISDNSHESLPDEFNDFFVLGQLKRRRVLSAISHNPRLLYDLGKLGYRARTAGHNLAAFLETNLPRLHLPALAARQLQ
jgi:hypothetical protein